MTISYYMELYGNNGSLDPSTHGESTIDEYII